jgi:hypothetical protein
VEAMWFLCVTLGFVDLADHSRVHFQSPWSRDSERHAQHQRAFQVYNGYGIKNTRIGKYSKSSIVRFPGKVNHSSCVLSGRTALVRQA